VSGEMHRLLLQWLLKMFRKIEDFRERSFWVKAFFLSVCWCDILVLKRVYLSCVLLDYHIDLSDRSHAPNVEVDQDFDRRTCHRKYRKTVSDREISSFNSLYQLPSFGRLESRQVMQIAVLNLLI
jgi:hypothetical protein